MRCLLTYREFLSNETKKALDEEMNILGLEGPWAIVGTNAV